MSALPSPGMDTYVAESRSNPPTVSAATEDHHQIDTLYLAAFACLPLGERLVPVIVRSEVSPRWLWEASAQDVAGALRMKPAAALELVFGRNRISPSGEMEKLRSAGIRICAPWDAGYPTALRTIPHPPALLYSRGTIRWPAQPGVAVVGSRSCTAYGRKIAEDIAFGLARAGVSVVSGVARGIDACAHRGAIKGGGITVGVLGCGADVVYPTEHRSLYPEIVRKGTLISEYPPGAQPLPWRFPARNRIISGLSRAVVVVEAGETSGALITANHALDQGREVFVVPGSVYSPASRGSHRLLKDGAVPVCSAEEVLEELGLPTTDGLQEKEGVSPAQVESESPLAQETKVVLSAVPWTPATVDEIALSAGLPAAGTLAALLILEMKGLVLCEKGKRYLRVR